MQADNIRKSSIVSYQRLLYDCINLQILWSKVAVSSSTSNTSSSNWKALRWN
jgi:hypothetical protein